MLNKIDRMCYLKEQNELMLSADHTLGCLEDLETDIADIEYNITDDGNITMISLFNYENIKLNLIDFELPNLGMFKYRDFDPMSLTELVKFALTDLINKKEYVKVYVR